MSTKTHSTRGCSMSHAPCLLASLPHELLLYQLAFFRDLASHLAFSITCSRIHALYDDALWRRISISSGLGRPLDLASDGRSWRRLCLTAVVHARVCSLPDCSVANLSKGRDRGFLEPPCNLVSDRHRIHSEQIELHLSPIFEGLSGDLEDLYSASIPCNPNPKPWRLKQLFQNPLENDLLDSIALPAPYAGEYMVTKLAHHFPASCALATVPAVDRLDLDVGQEIIHVRNKDGVCVWDVVSALAKKMFEVVPSTVTDGGKAPMRIYQVIASEWQQYVMLRFSLHERGSINAHLDLGEEIFENFVSSAPT